MPVSPFDTRGRFTRNHLSFAGRNSKEFLLYLSGPGVYDSPAADVEATAVPGKNGDILTTTPTMPGASATRPSSPKTFRSLPPAAPGSPGRKVFPMWKSRQGGGRYDPMFRHPRMLRQIMPQNLWMQGLTVMEIPTLLLAAGLETVKMYLFVTR